MAQGAVSRASRSRRSLSGPVLKIVVVEVPATWRPVRVLDLPPDFAVVDRDGPYDAQSVREIQAEFNTAELDARRRGRPANLWMLAVAEGGAA